MSLATELTTFIRNQNGTPDIGYNVIAFIEERTGLHLIPHPKKRKMDKAILEQIKNAFSTKSRQAKYAIVRQIVWSLLYARDNIAVQSIAQSLGYDHVTVLHGINNIYNAVLTCHTDDYTRKVNEHIRAINVVDVESLAAILPTLNERILPMPRYGKLYAQRGEFMRRVNLIASTIEQNSHERTTG